jgi:tripartite-type tricarboxylate transporter receptor subunit TctC
MFPVLGTIAAHLKTGKVRALAITTRQPSPLLPGLPTISESALPGYDVSGVFGLFAAAGTPQPVVTRLSQEIAASLKRTEIRERFFASGVETVGSSPEEFAAQVKSEMTTLGKLIREAGIKN